MIALFMLAQIAATPVPDAPPPEAPYAMRQPILNPPPAACRRIAEKVAARQHEGFRRLGELPPASAEYAVIRMIDGCGVPAPVGYHPAPPDER